MKGYIVINPYRYPIESVRQAERIKQEFDNLGVNVNIVNDGFIKSMVYNGNLVSELSDADFILYLDKDKYLSGVLSKLNCKLFNSHEAIRVCDDKGETYIALSNCGLKIPDTVLGELCYKSDLELDYNIADNLIEKLSLPIIVKESFGSMGKGVYKADDKEQLNFLISKMKGKPHLYQKFIKTSAGVDVRVIVIGGKVVSAMERRNKNDFRSNVALGGECRKVDLIEEFKTCAEKVAKILKLDYCGVDLLYGEDENPYICEVNSNAFFFGMEKTTGVNIAKKYAEYILDKLEK